jgi:hypothetical protein
VFVHNVDTLWTNFLENRIKGVFRMYILGTLFLILRKLFQKLKFWNSLNYKNSIGLGR